MLDLSQPQGAHIDQRLRSELAEVGEVFIDVTARGGGRDHAGAGL